MNQLRQTKTILFEFVTMLSENRKISIRYILILLPVAICMGAVCFTDTGTGSGILSKIFQLFLFCVAGVLHLYFLQKRILFHWFRFLGDGILYTSISAFLIFASLGIFYLLAGKQGTWMMAIASSCTFAFPHFLLHAWHVYNEIPGKEFLMWTKPLRYDKGEEILFTEPCSVEFRIRRKYFDVEEEAFEEKVPGHTKLGAAFFAVLKEEAKNGKKGIEFFDGQKNLYAWEFYLRQFNGYISPRRLDPELTICESGISPGAIIIVKRVLQSKEKLSLDIFSKN